MRSNLARLARLLPEALENVSLFANCRNKSERFHYFRQTNQIASTLHVSTFTQTSQTPQSSINPNSCSPPFLFDSAFPFIDIYSRHIQASLPAQYFHLAYLVPLHISFLSYQKRSIRPELAQTDFQTKNIKNTVHPQTIWPFSCPDCRQGVALLLPC